MIYLQDYLAWKETMKNNKNLGKEFCKRFDINDEELISTRGRKRAKEIIYRRHITMTKKGA